MNEPDITIVTGRGNSIRVANNWEADAPIAKNPDADVFWITTWDKHGQQVNLSMTAEKALQLVQAIEEVANYYE